MIKLFHSPHSRSSGILWLLEELDISYEVELINIRNVSGAPEGYREIHPHKKVPAIIHDGAVITERAAIALYLCDIFTDNTLAPLIGDPRRGAYLSMLIYCDSVLDPLMAARVQGWTYKSMDFSFGNFDDMVQFLEKKLSSQLYAIGNEFTAVDTQLGSAIHWGVNLAGVLPKKSVFMNYLNRIATRPAFLSAIKKDEEFAKKPFSDPQLFNYKQHISHLESGTQNNLYGDGYY